MGRYSFHHKSSCRSLAVHNLDAVAVAHSLSISCGACPFNVENDARTVLYFFFDINSP